MKLSFRYSRLVLWTVLAIAAFAFTSFAQGDKIDTGPLRDFGKSVQARIDKKELDVTRPFSVEMNAVITPDGKLDRNASKFTAESGDPKMVGVAKEAIFAAGDSGYFSYVRQLGLDHARINLSQTNDTFQANVFGEQNAIKARMTAAGVDMILSIAAGNERNGANERLIIQNTHASAGGGGVNITCTLPAADFQRMILNNSTAAAPVN
ncbi:MAG TPA: hypothetical protein VL501_06775 [Pyrinomonadaceae bacterium]|nr:hypothetical protein [Pyrinomonadaceae bacterium]